MRLCRRQRVTVPPTTRPQSCSTRRCRRDLVELCRLVALLHAARGACRRRAPRRRGPSPVPARPGGAAPRGGQARRRLQAPVSARLDAAPRSRGRKNGRPARIGRVGHDGVRVVTDRVTRQPPEAHIASSPTSGVVGHTLLVVGCLLPGLLCAVVLILPATLPVIGRSLYITLSSFRSGGRSCSAHRFRDDEDYDVPVPALQRLLSTARA